LGATQFLKKIVDSVLLMQLIASKELTLSQKTTDSLSLLLQQGWMLISKGYDILHARVSTGSAFSCWLASSSSSSSAVAAINLR
jgi:hypothetical protein